MKKRIFFCLLSVFLLIPRASAKEDYIRWVEFDVGLSPMQRALELDIASQGEEPPLSWIDLLALAATRCGGGKGITASQIDRAAKELRGGRDPKELLGAQYKYFSYYREAYHAVLGGLVGHYAIEVPNRETGTAEWVPAYGLKAFSPIAAGYGYAHYDDFGAKRTFGYTRPHLGHDLMSAVGTPVIAVESGKVECLGWNRYGGWRIGIRSLDNKRYWYYAHLRQNRPYAENLKEGDTVTAGDVIGYVGRTGYSDTENINGITESHLHIGLELVFDESQKESDNEIWVDMYALISTLEQHKSSTVRNSETKEFKREFSFKEIS